MAIEKVLVVAELSGGAPAATTLELLSAARSIAPQVEAIAWGSGVAGAAAELGNYGASTVHDVGDLGGALPGAPVAAGIAALVSSGDVPDVVLVPNSYDGRDVAGRLSAKLDRPVITNAVGLRVEGDGVVSEHAIFGGAQVATARFTGEHPWIFIVRAKTFEPVAAGGAAANVVSVPTSDLGPAGAAKILERHVEEREGPALDEADVVVSGGRGMGSKDSYAMVEDLAKILSGAPGASRAIVDAGWVPYSYQVGQTGKTVKPNLYIACGISGATQHLVGMKGAKNIIAINKDQDAPIFSVADLGIVGDVQKVLPKLIEALRAR